MLDFITKVFKKIFGSHNDRIVKRLRVVAEKANALEGEFRALSDEQLKGTTEKLREKLRKGAGFDDILPEAFAACREAGRRVNKMRHFDSQFVGGQVLHNGWIAEMATGEGKTLVATLPCYLNALAGLKVHVWSVNDYLVKRDRDWMNPIYEALGLTAGAIQSHMGSYGAGADERKAAYGCDITYGTNSELGFDYLRDNMKMRLADQVQGIRDFGIVDEADSILIDEARTPLIISGPAADDTTRYEASDKVARRLLELHKPYKEAKDRKAAAELAIAKAEADLAEARRRSDKKAEDKARQAKTDAEKALETAENDLAERTAYYEVELDRHTVRMTHEGIAAAQETAGVGSFYVGANMEWPHLMEQSLKAHLLYERDKNYAVHNGEVKIVDEFTGRILEGRQWSDGLHQAVEAKERVKIKEETQTLATITIQNFARLYGKLAGMTGTAMTEAEELAKIYGVDVVAVPTNRPVNRQDHHDFIFQSLPEKNNAVVEEIHDVRQHGRPHQLDFYYPVLTAMQNVYEFLAANPGKLHGPPPEKADSLLGQLRTMTATLKGADSVSDKTMEECSALVDTVAGSLRHGRPVLVGTTSIEKSEKLSATLQKRYGIDHQVLNARPDNARRESEIVAEAGQLKLQDRGPHAGQRWGTVTIATNMAGRGTDIKLAEGVVYDKCRGDLGPGSGQPDAVALRMWKEPGITGTKCCMNCPDYDPATNCAHCFKPKLDARFPEYGRQVCPISPPCGLHIIGTERHESRRIDNQLRGRAGRQGDPGSSQFFLSLEDELLKVFMPEWVSTAFRWMGLKEGERIQHPRLTRGIEGAQLKVEERHFGARKHLLEYDEVNNQQRRVFYTRRQAILENREIQQTIREMLEETIDATVADHYDSGFRGRGLFEWAKTAQRLKVDPYYVRAGMSSDALDELLRQAARDRIYDDDVFRDAHEYLEEEVPPKQWNLNGLANWAKTMFGVELPPRQKLLEMTRDEIFTLIQTEAEKQIPKLDTKPAHVFLEANHHTDMLTRWANEKFGFELKPELFAGQSAEQARKLLWQKVEDAWHQREIEEPIRHALAHYDHLKPETTEAAVFLSNWVANRYKATLPAEKIQGRPPKELLTELSKIAAEWVTGGKLEQVIDAELSRSSLPKTGPARPAPFDPLTDDIRNRPRLQPVIKPAPSPAAVALADWAEKQFQHRPNPTDLTDQATARRELLEVGRNFLRQEMSRLEQRLLLDTYDRAWKDHLYGMDALKDFVGFQGYAERDPRNVYKRDGFELFQAMLSSIRDRVTSRIFKLEISDHEEANSIYQITAAIHAEFAGFEQPLPLPSAAGEASTNAPAGKHEPFVRETPAVGRNDLCPCGSGKKFKKCHGKTSKV